MIQLNFKEYLVELVNEPEYNIDSKDNQFNYKHVFSTPSLDQYQPSSKHGIKIFMNHKPVNSALILGHGGGTGVHDTMGLVDGNKILICCGDAVFCLSLPALHLIWSTKADDTTCFQLFKLQDGYVIHGELEITKLKQDGSIEWTVRGKDIFVGQHGKSEFKITEKCIEVRDWNNELYKIGFNGKII